MKYAVCIYRVEKFGTKLEHVLLQEILWKFSLLFSDIVLVAYEYGCPEKSTELRTTKGSTCTFRRAPHKEYNFGVTNC
jgi:hypothetical protein